MKSKQIKALGINEVFLPRDGFESYEVSNYGNVRNSKPGVHKRLRKMKKGYYITDWYNDKHVLCSTKTIHRLVLNAFEENLEKKACFDHIDNNPFNNCLFNLRKPF